MGNRLFLLLLLFFFLNGKGKGECLSVPYVVVLGASMVDVGENAAAMPLRSSSEFPPFGLDYFPSPAARYSNGRLFIDFLTQDLGHGLLHPYLYSLAPDFSHGVNFASSGSTAYNSTITGTGENSGGLFSFLVQVDQLSMFLSAVKTGSAPKVPTTEMMKEALVFIETGLNDYVKTAYRTSDYDPMVAVESTMAIMEMGIRKLVVMNLLPLGCIPGTRGDKDYLSFERDSQGCVVVINQLISLHNRRLQEMVQSKLVPLYPSSTLLIFDVHSLYRHATLNPSMYGLKYPMDYCCGYAYNDTLCIACGGSAYVNAQIYKGSRCDDPSLYIYWDGMHPTESFGRHIANGILTGSHMIPSFRLERSCPYRDHSSTY